MNRREFCIKYAKEKHITQAEAVKTCRSVLNFLARSIIEEDKVQLANLGVFKKKMTKARNLVNVNDGSIITLPEKEKIVFKAADNIQDAYNDCEEDFDD